jgi:hypothetical protein
MPYDPIGSSFKMLFVVINATYKVLLMILGLLDVDFLSSANI